MVRLRLASVVVCALVIGALQPGPATAFSSDPTIRARQVFFGLDAVDPQTGDVRSDRVIFSWFGTSNFAVALNGHVVVIDTYFPSHNGRYLPVDVDDLAALDPSHVFIGHGHFDHAQHVPDLVERTGAVVVGTPTHCAEVLRKVVAECVEAIPDSAALGFTRELTLLDGVGITAVLHPHSAAELPAFADPNGPYVPTVPPPNWQARVSNPPDPATLERDEYQAPEGGTILYQFRVGDFAVVHHDSTGPVKVGDPVWQALRVLPSTDVQIGAVVNFGQLTNGMRDVRIYAEALEPRIFVPNHHDDWNPVLGSRGENYEGPVRAELDKIEADRRPVIRWLYDPYDYVRPGVLTFDPDAPVWR